jgi:hypothetical protein
MVGRRAVCDGVNTVFRIRNRNSTINSLLELGLFETGILLIRWVSDK